MYILQRNRDGEFVARSGGDRSYVVRVQDAQVFATREEAEQHRRGNETIRTVDDVIAGR